MLSEIQDYCIRVNPDELHRYTLSREQSHALTALDGKSMTLPADKRHWLSKAFIVHRYSNKKLLQELPSQEVWVGS